MIGREMPKLGKRLLSPPLLPLPHQPQRTLVHEHAPREQHRGGRELEPHRQPPTRGGGGAHVLVDAKVYPEADDGAGLVGQLEEAGEDAADGGDGELGDVGGDGGGYGAAGYACEGAAGVWESVSSLCLCITWDMGCGWVGTGGDTDV